MALSVDWPYLLDGREAMKIRVIGALLSCALALSACGGGGGSGDGVAEPQVAFDENDTVAAENTDNTDTENSDEIVSIIETIAVGQVQSGSVAFDAFDLFRVPADSQIIVTTESGDADLFLFSDEDLQIFLCSATQPFIEDSCSGSDPDGEVFAVVFGREASEYNITVSVDCTVPAINDWVNRSMQDYYLFADNVPVVNPANFNSPSSLLNELRFQELDRFSNVADDAEGRQQFLAEGLAFGFGHIFRFDAEGNARIARVYDDSPFGRAGVKRGDISLGINNELWGDIDAARFEELVGDMENPLATTWQFIDGETGERKSPLITQAEYRVNTVLFDTIYDNSSFDGRTGYIVFNQFLRTSEAELDAAIQRLNDGGATELILDLRYNTGGFISIANRLASQIAGADLAGNVLVRYEYNDEYTSENFDNNFEAATPELGFERVVILTTGSTASSSEIVINALKPYIDVVVIGARTSGKPFISTANNFCGYVLNAMEAQGVNANGVSVAGGITPDCFAEDDPTRNFGGGGDNVEGMLLSALDYVAFGTCDVGAPIVAARKSAVPSYLVDDFPALGAVIDSRGRR